MLERKSQSQIVADIKARHGLACKVLPFNVIGIPDLMVAFRRADGSPTGLFLVELKKDDGDLAAIQMARISWLNDLGVRAYVCYGISGWITLRDKYMSGEL